MFFVWEHPADPESYMGSANRPPQGWVSWWSFPEWKDFAQEYKLNEARLDQGKFGHERPKPTVVATNSWFLYEALHMQVLTKEERALFGIGPRAGSQRLERAPTWGKWAPGLVVHVVQA